MAAPSNNANVMSDTYWFVEPGSTFEQSHLPLQHRDTSKHLKEVLAGFDLCCCQQDCVNSIGINKASALRKTHDLCLIILTRQAPTP